MSEQETSGNASRPGSPDSQKHLLFVWSPTGYQLAEQEGEPPALGDEVEHADRRYRVIKIGPSPLPGDERVCAFLQA